MMRPIKYVARINYPDPEHPTTLEIFRTKKAYDEWYQKFGRGFDMVDLGVQVELTVSPAENDDKFFEDQSK